MTGGILLASVTALGWGIGDFYGGVASRRWPSLLVVLGSMTLATLLLLSAILLRGGGFNIEDDLPWAMAAGALGVLSLTGLFRLLARGNMAVSAPLVALTTAVVPVAFGVIRGGWPGSWQLLGVLIALLAIPLVAQGNAGAAAASARPTLRVFLEPALIGAGFGIGLICLNQIDTPDLLAPLLIQRLTSIPLLCLILWFSPGRRSALRIGAGEIFAAIRPALGWVAVIGLCDLAANGAFIVASQLTGITIASVIGSMHPAITVVMARLIDQEQMRKRQVIGLALSLLAMALISLR